MNPAHPAYAPLPPRRILHGSGGNTSLTQWRRAYVMAYRWGGAPLNARTRMAPQLPACTPCLQCLRSWGAPTHPVRLTDLLAGFQFLIMHCASYRAGTGCPDRNRVEATLVHVLRGVPTRPTHP